MLQNVKRCKFKHNVIINLKFSYLPSNAGFLWSIWLMFHFFFFFISFIECFCFLYRYHFWRENNSHPSHKLIITPLPMYRVITRKTKNFGSVEEKRPMYNYQQYQQSCHTNLKTQVSRRYHTNYC